VGDTGPQAQRRGVKRRAQRGYPSDGRTGVLAWTRVLRWIWMGRWFCGRTIKQPWYCNQTSKYDDFAVLSCWFLLAKCTSVQNFKCHLLFPNFNNPLFILPLRLSGLTKIRRALFFLKGLGEMYSNLYRNFGFHKLKTTSELFNLIN